MNKPIIHVLPQQRRAHGMVLVVALVFLLVMTIIGGTALSSSIMQGLMSSSYQQQTVALTLAENLLVEAELDIEDLVATSVDGRDFYINLDADPAAVFAAASTVREDWPNNFVIEYVGPFAVPGESVAEGGGLDDRELHIFRISARGERAAAERGGLRILQSLYVTLIGPDA